MSTLYVDTATSDRWRFPRGGKPAPDEEQPFMVRLAWLLEAADGNTVRETCHLVKLPPGLRMAGEAAHHTGIYDHHLQGGRAMAAYNVLTEFAEALGEAKLIVAHSWQFHKQVLERSMRYVGMPAREWPPGVCAMIKATNIVQIPDQRPGGKWKWPSFSQCCERFLGHDMQVSQDPVGDGIERVRAVRLFYSNIKRET